MFRGNTFTLGANEPIRLGGQVFQNHQQLNRFVHENFRVQPQAQVHVMPGNGHHPPFPGHHPRRIHQQPARVVPIRERRINEGVGRFRNVTPERAVTTYRDLYNEAKEKVNNFAQEKTDE